MPVLVLDLLTISIHDLRTSMDNKLPIWCTTKLTTNSHSDSFHTVQSQTISVGSVLASMVYPTSALLTYKAYVKLLLFFNKKDGVSYEQFLRHWQTVHADLTVATEGFRVSNIQRYTQVRRDCLKSVKELLKLGQTHQTADRKSRVKSAGADSLDFDGCSEMWVKSWDDWVKLANVSPLLLYTFLLSTY